MNKNLDLDIDNYDLNDLLQLFNIDYNYTSEDLKSCKKMVLKTHPDKSSLDKKYFMFFSKAYKLLFQIHQFRHKTGGKQEDFEKDYDAEYDIEKENEAIINKIKNSKNFNKVFNDIFEKMSFNNNDNGYDEWYKNDVDDISKLSCKNTGEMASIINKKKASMESVMINYDISEMSNTYGQSNLEETTSHFSSDIFSKLRYDDLKDAHENSLIPVMDNNVKQRYSNAEQLREERKRVINPLSEHESNNILNNKKIHDEKIATTRAFNLAKQEEYSRKQNQILLSKFKQIMN